MCAAKSLRKAKSRLPLWGALVPSGHRSAPTEPAGESALQRRAERAPETTFSLRYRPGKALRCFPSSSLAVAHLRSRSRP